MHAGLFDEWSHYIICLPYSRPPSTFLALSVGENNGPFVKLAKAVLLQYDPRKNCFWAEPFLSETVASFEHGSAVWRRDKCLAHQSHSPTPPPAEPPPGASLSSLTSIPRTETFLYNSYFTNIISVNLINRSTTSNSYFVYEKAENHTGHNLIKITQQESCRIRILIPKSMLFLVDNKNTIGKYCRRTSEIRSLNIVTHLFNKYGPNTNLGNGVNTTQNVLCFETYILEAEIDYKKFHLVCGQLTNYIF